ncbi:uncharacterized protein DC041_0002427 [Schistosoma bovis]|uniref:Retinol dehydrogenase 12 n=1 Tax=Schistosoma bovis TaxID=6184 RepID=A0A430Q1V1_SCHBO|nr:uncharacterized protein DC041_0002427 [Schistosoma bovis]
MHAVELSERLHDSGITVVSVHPGAVKTEIFRDVKDCSLMANIYQSMEKSFPWKGAQTTLYTVLSDNIISGGYYSNCSLKEPLTIVKNKDERKWFWNKTCELLRIENTT